MYYTIGRFFNPSPHWETLRGIHFLRLPSPPSYSHLVFQAQFPSPGNKRRESLHDKGGEKNRDIQLGTSVDRRLRGHHRLDPDLGQLQQAAGNHVARDSRARHRHRHGGEHHVAQRLRRARHDLRRSRHHHEVRSAQGHDARFGMRCPRCRHQRHGDQRRASGRRQAHRGSRLRLYRISRSGHHLGMVPAVQARHTHGPVFRVGSPGFHVHHGHLRLLLQRG